MTSREHIADAGAIILAGGASRRMGRDKGLLDYRGVPLVQHVAGQLQACFSDIVLSTNQLEDYAFLGLPMVADARPGDGPLVGILSCLTRAPHPWSFVIAVDVPEAPLELVHRMAAERAGHDLVLPKEPSGRFQPLFAFYHRDLADPIRQQLASGDNRVHGLLESAQVRAMTVGEGTLANLNTPAEYARYSG